MDKTYDAFGCTHVHVNEFGHDVHIVDHNAYISLELDGDRVAYHKEPTFCATGITLRRDDGHPAIEYSLYSDPLHVISLLPEKRIVDVALMVFGHDMPTSRHPFRHQSDTYCIKVA